MDGISRSDGQPDGRDGFLAFLSFLVAIYESRVMESETILSACPVSLKYHAKAFVQTIEAYLYLILFSTADPSFPVNKNKDHGKTSSIYHAWCKRRNHAWCKWN